MPVYNTYTVTTHVLYTHTEASETSVGKLTSGRSILGVDLVRTRPASRRIPDCVWHQVLYEFQPPQPVVFEPPNYNRTSTDGHVTVTDENSVFEVTSPAENRVLRTDRRRPRDVDVCGRSCVVRARVRLISCHIRTGLAITQRRPRPRVRRCSSGVEPRVTTYARGSTPAAVSRSAAVHLPSPSERHPTTRFLKTSARRNVCRSTQQTTVIISVDFRVQA